MSEPTVGADSTGGGASRGDLLLVDNDAKIVELLSWFLGSRGFQVRVAASFVEARERLAERRPDLLISDVDLGVESALVELPRLSGEGLLPPTLVVSGFLDEAVRQSIFGVPEVLDSLPKPFEFPDLEAKVVACLGSGPRIEPEPAHEIVPAAPPVAVEPPAVPTHPVAAEPVPLAPGASAPILDEDDDDDDGWIEISPGG